MKHARVVLPGFIMLGLTLWVIREIWVSRWHQGVGKEPQWEFTPDADLLDATPSREPAPAPPVPKMREPRPATTLLRGPLLVSVIGLDGEPVVSAFVRLVHASTDVPARAPGDSGYVSGRGEIRFRDVRYDGSARMTFFHRDPSSKGPPAHRGPMRPREARSASVVVTGPTLLYRAGTGLWLDVSVVDAESGEAIAGARIAANSATEARGRRPTPNWMKPLGPIRVAPVPGEALRVLYEVQPIDGYCPPLREPSVQPLSPYAQRLMCLHPMRPETLVLVSATDESGEAVSARLETIQMGRHPIRGWRVEGDAYGRLSIRGVPFLRGERIHLTVAPADMKEDGFGEWVSGFIPEQRDAPLSLSVVFLDEEIESSEELDDTPAASAGKAVSDHVADWDADTPGTFLELQVLRYNGQPAVNAHVHVAGLKRTDLYTDKEGTVRIEGLPPGKHRVTASQVGLLRIESTVHVHAKKASRARVHEREGGTVSLQVTDEKDRALPFATVYLQQPSGWPWVDLPGIVQRTDGFVDQAGRRTLTRIEPGEVVITVDWGTRTLEKKLRVEDGWTHEVTFVLPAPKQR